MIGEIVIFAVIFLLGMALTTLVWAIAMFILGIVKAARRALRPRVKRKVEPKFPPIITEMWDYDPNNTIEAKRGRDFRRMYR